MEEINIQNIYGKKTSHLSTITGTASPSWANYGEDLQFLVLHNVDLVRAPYFNSVYVQQRILAYYCQVGYGVFNYGIQN